MSCKNKQLFLMCFFFLWKPKSHQDVNVQQNRQVLFSNVIKWLSEKVPHGCVTWLSYLLQKDNHFCQSFIESGSSFVGPICLLVNKIGRHLYHCQLPHFLRKTVSSYIQSGWKFFIDIHKNSFKLFQFYFLLNRYMWLTFGNLFLAVEAGYEF